MEILALGLGGLLLLVAILGGGFELKEIRIPSVGWKPRLAAAIIGFFFTVLGINFHYAGIENRGTVQPTLSTNGTSAARPVPIAAVGTVESNSVESHKASLISAIRLADQVEANAMRTLDPAPLYQIYVGEALRTEHNYLKTLRAEGIYQVSQLENQAFQSFDVSPDGSRARVRVIETWNTILYRIDTGQCVQTIPSHAAPQTIHLVRNDSGWMIENVVHELDAQPIAVRCP